MGLSETGYGKIRSMQRIVVYTDGGARGNPGPGAIGIVIYLQGENTQKIHSFGKTIGISTNNNAEYTAVAEAFNWLTKNLNKYSANTPIDFCLDSTLVVNQLNGTFKTKKLELINLLFSIKSMQQKLKAPISFNYIPREKNSEADMLVNKALDEQIYES